MVEQAGGPANGVVAGAAIDRLGSLLELPGMNIFVTPDALLRRRLESDGPQMCIDGCCGAMTIETTEHTVAAHQRERGHSVIEDFQIAPRLQTMARLANALPRLDARREDLRKLILVWVLMTAFTGGLGEMIFPVGPRGSFFLAMTILAGDGGVRTLQGEVG